MKEKIEKFFFKRYEERDHREMQKAKVITAFYFFIGILLFVVMLALIFVQNKEITYPGVLGILVVQGVIFIALMINISGRNEIAAHIMIVTISTVIWAILFLKTGKSDLVTTVDTISYIFPLIVVSTIVTNRVSIAIYTAVNIAMTVFYSINTYNGGFFSRMQMFDFIADTSVSLLLTGLGCFSFLNLSIKY